MQLRLLFWKCFINQVRDMAHVPEFHPWLRRLPAHTQYGREHDFQWAPVSPVKVKESEVAQSCPTLCDPADCSPPGSSAHGILQARVLEWVAISFSRGSARPRDWTQVSHIAGRRFNLWATRGSHQCHLWGTYNSRCLGGTWAESRCLKVQLYIYIYF